LECARAPRDKDRLKVFQQGAEMALADPVPPFEGLVGTEASWRHRPRLRWGTAETERLTVARWTSADPSDQVCGPSASAGCHVLEVNLRPTDAALRVDGLSVHDGRLPAGSVLLTQAGCRIEARYRSACDLLHFFVPVRRFETLLREAGLWDVGGPFGLAEQDPVISRLALSLLASQDLDGPGAQLYAESVAAAILARVVGRAGSATGVDAGKRAGLVKWRHRRVVEFIDANLADPIRLPDLARAAGLSRMHFAAQFRAATGIRPHEFVLRRRIERAQDLLRDSALPLAQVALGVGFQTQAHFTTVFRDHVQETPGRWRQLHRSG
jgi:AraC-like DNA-binding protein